jgi:hypothetical protein
MKMSEMFRLHRYEPAELFERVKAAAIADGGIKETKEYKFFKEPYELSDDWDWGALADQSEKFEREIQDLIDRMVQRVGPAETRKIFEKSAKAITKAKIAERKNSSKILERYDHMLNASALARQLAKEGGGTTETALQRINDWRRKRKAAIAKGTWDGPPLWDRELNSYARRKGMIKI